MISKIIIAALALACAFVTSAEARPNTQAGYGRTQSGYVMIGCSDPVMKPCATGVTPRHSARNRRQSRSIAASPLSFSWSAAVSRPAHYIAGRLVCAVNVNAELARRGIRGTGSALAKSFLHWGRASRPVAGAVAVYGRRGGGHVAIVSRVVNGRVYVWNPSSRRHQWREVEYRKRAISYRVAAQ